MASFSEILASLKDGDWKLFLKEYTGKMKSPRDVLARYDGSISYVDSEIGRLLDGLKKLGALENTLIIITADHGESLTEHGIYFDHHGLYDELIHVPLIMCCPEKIPSKKIATTIQHIDLMPTILSLAGIGYDENNFDGKSLVPLLREAKNDTEWRPFVFVEEARSERKFAIRTEKFKYICAPSEAEAICNYCGRIHGGVEELYDLKLDPGEKHNIVSEKPDIRNELRGTLLNFRAELETKRERQKLGARVRKLRAAGKL